MQINEKNLYILLETTKESLPIRGAGFRFSREEREAAVDSVIASMEKKSVEVVSGEQRIIPTITRFPPKEKIEPIEEEQEDIEEEPEPKTEQKLGKLARPRQFP